MASRRCGASGANRRPRSRHVVSRREDLSTVRDCDRIYVIERGGIVEVGDHRSLMAGGGLYARLARAQNLEPIGA